MKKLLVICISLILPFLFMTQVFSAETAWQDLGGGKARMIATKDPATDKILGLVEVKLNKGWKTYWRSPGSSGIPPEFDFTNSSNVLITGTHFPIPKWIKIPDAEFYGYTDKVSFVFEADAGGVDSEIALDLLIGVCEEICIPASAQFVLPANQLNASDPKSGISISLAKSKLPQSTSETLKIENISVLESSIQGIVLGEDINNVVDVVLELPDYWVSDPITATQTAERKWIFEASLPKRLQSSSVEKQNWRYSIISRSAESEKIISAVEGTYSINSN